jgi:outer membrane protein OmpA-like peptidoglycan-associated protein
MFLVLVLSISFSAFAQNADHPVKFGFGTHRVDYNVNEDYFGDLIDTTYDWNSGFALNRLTMGGTLNPSFSLSGSASFAYIDKELLNTPEDLGMFMDLDLTLFYHLANGYIFPVRSCTDPYVFAGAGLNYTDINNKKRTAFTPKLGLGFDFWLTEQFGLNLQTAYAIADDEGIDYLQHSAGLIIRFGKGEDTDGDGIPNWQDACPDKAGIEKFMGCPDTDNDGITDAQDVCPNDAGSATFGGCPDSDNDGLADKDDTCPNEKGLAQYGGCPDTDEDGIADRDDRCPKDAGPTALSGCPDADGDNIADLDDACKNEKGLEKFNGCPDSDNDGIMDKEDRCPKERGDKAMNGCPDNDGDGIADFEDSCPDKPGVKANRGCPAIEEKEKKEIIEKINYAAKAIQFESGKDVIKPSSYATLDNIVSIMKLYIGTNWSIEGHTDDQGDDKMNQDLSDRRAAAVKKYFIDKGIKESRLSSVGYGESKPIANNKTSAGRAQNRRVEILLVEEK